MLVGAGPMAIAYAAALKALGVQFHVWGRGSESARSFERATGIAARLGGLPDQLSPASTAIVAVGVQDLASVTIQLLERGCRRILVEKPGALDGAELARVSLAAQRAASALVFVAYNRRFYPSVKTAAALIEEDGGLTSLHFSFTEIAHRVAEIQKPLQVKNNWFFANSTHVVNLAFHLGSWPTTIHAAVAGGCPGTPAAAALWDMDFCRTAQLSATTRTGKLLEAGAWR